MRWTARAITLTELAEERGFLGVLSCGGRERVGVTSVKRQITFILTLAATALFSTASQQTSAKAVAGSRVFPLALTMDDGGVADEASVPTYIRC